MDGRRSVSIKELADAIRKNGYKQGFGHMVNRKHGEVIDACAIGQAALNLGVSTASLASELRNIRIKDDIYQRSLWTVITADNDNQKFPLDKIADNVERLTVFPTRMSVKLKQ